MKIIHSAGLAALSVLACLACGTPEGTLTASTLPNSTSVEREPTTETPFSTLVLTEQVNGGCSPFTQALTGQGKPGEACSAAEACVSVCCRCASPGYGARGYRAAACIGEVCATPADTCAATRSLSLCPEAF